MLTSTAAAATGATPGDAPAVAWFLAHERAQRLTGGGRTAQ
jgi:hypothetical protein